MGQTSSTDNITIECDSLDFYHGTIIKGDGSVRANMSADRKAGKINDSTYSLSVTAPISTDSVTINAGSMDFTIYSLTAFSNDEEAVKLFDSVCIDPDTGEVVLGALSVILEDDSEVNLMEVGGYYGEDKTAATYFELETPIDTTKVKGIKIENEKYWVK